MIMVGHLSCVGIDGGSRPASLSKAVVTSILRGEMGYDGLVITDSLGMGAVTAVASSYDVGVLALEAGCDLILAPADFDAAYQGVLDAVRSGRISQERIDESLYRVVSAKLDMA
jgi:beta-N-acetylhexosaminidase